MNGRSGLALACALVFAFGCGGGSNGGPTTPPASIVFTPSGTAGANSVALVSGSGSSGTTLILTVRVTQVTGVYGVAFDLVYPSAQLQFADATEGSFLSGTATSFQFSETTAGRVVVGISRLGAVAGVSGSGDLMTLRFTSRGVAGSGALSFQSHTAFNSTAKAISGVTWLGGSVTVTP